MKDKELKTLVDGALALHREIATKSEQLKRFKTQLVQHGRLHAHLLASTESGGKRWVVEGSNGCIARVSFPAPGIIGAFETGTDSLAKVQNVAGEKFRRLFASVKIFQPVENFRVRAAALLPAPKAEALIDLCETEIAPRVSFEVAKSSDDQAKQEASKASQDSLSKRH